MTSRIPTIFKKFAKKEKAIDLIKKWKVVRGDTVEVISGPHKNKQGTVLKVLRGKNSVLIDGINLHQRIVKPTPAAPGKLYMAPGPVHYSNVSLVDPSLGKPTRLIFRYDEEGKKIRVSKKSGTIIPYPEILKERHTPLPTETGLLDTPPELVLERTVTDDEL